MTGYFAYRLPGQTKIYSGSGPITNGLNPDSFVIAPFEMPVENAISIAHLYTPPLAELCRKIDAALSTLDTTPFSTPNPALYALEVESIINSLQGDRTRKCVAARPIIGSEAIEIEQSFLTLCDKFPNSFVFLFLTPSTGGWIGATPELLLSANGTQCITYSLAGTRPAATPTDWDSKNLDEQQIVTDFIVDTLLASGLTPTVGERHTRVFGSIEHLLTPIAAPLPSNLRQLLSNLAPTPALSGMPKQEALEMIARHEPEPRGCYGGFCGPMKTDSSFAFFVTIRAMQFTSHQWRIMAGGGITADSDFDSEWLETERKALTILSNIKFKKQNS